MNSTRKLWLGIGTTAVLLPAATWLFFRRLEERAWREVNAVWEAGVEDYREYVVHAARSAETDWLMGEMVFMDWGDPPQQERTRLGLHWRRTLRYSLERVPPRLGLQIRASITLEAERTWFGTSLRAHVLLIEKGRTDPRWSERLEAIFTGTDVEYYVSWAD